MSSGILGLPAAGPVVTGNKLVVVQGTGPGSDKQADANLVRAYMNAGLTTSQIANDSGVAGADAQDALDTLGGLIAANGSAIGLKLDSGLLINAKPFAGVPTGVPDFPGQYAVDNTQTPWAVYVGSLPTAANPTGAAWDGPVTNLDPPAAGYLLGATGTSPTIETWRSPANARSDLGLVIGTDVQAFDADLAALAALDATAGLLAKTGANAYARRTLGATANRKLVVANGDGVAGPPTVGLDDGNANRLLGFNSSGAPAEILAGTGLSLVGGTLTATGGGGGGSGLPAGIGSVNRNKTIGGVSNFGRGSAHILSNSNRTLAADTEYHTDFLWLGGDGLTLDMIAIFVVTAAAGGIKVTIFNIDSAGWAGTTWLAQQSLTIGSNNSHSSAAITGGPTLNYGFWYRIVSVADNASAVRGFNGCTYDAPLGSIFGQPATILTRAGSYSTGIGTPPSNSAGTPNAATATASPSFQLRAA